MFYEIFCYCEERKMKASNYRKRSFTLIASLTGVTVVAALLCCGCSNKVSLRGKVTFADDGSPLTRGTVCFVAGQFVARGHLNDDGTYRVSSTGRNDGLPKGKYKVFLIGAELVFADGSGNSTYTPLVDSRYDSPDTSDIEFEVDGSVRQFDFSVERVRRKQ